MLLHFGVAEHSVKLVWVSFSSIAKPYNYTVSYHVNMYTDTLTRIDCTCHVLYMPCTVHMYCTYDHFLRGILVPDYIRYILSLTLSLLKTSQ